MSALMGTIRSACRALWLCAVASMLFSCGSTQSFNPLSSLQRGTTSFGRDAASDDLMYVAGRNTVNTYTFPQAHHKGSFKVPGLVSAMCSDLKGNVFIALTEAASGHDAGYVFEYPHGSSKPIAALQTPKHDVPVACSSDPTTGNLAVTLQNSADFEPSVAIYRKAAGTPKVYFTRALGANPQAGYDDHGNLLATSGGNVAAELVAGKARFVEITLAKTLGGVAHVQWDGKNFALESFDYSKHNRENIPERIFRLHLSRTTGKVVSTIRFHNWSQRDAGNSWIQGDEMVSTPFHSIVLWAYPAGGKALKVIHPISRGKAITISMGGQQP